MLTARASLQNVPWRGQRYGETVIEEQPCFQGIFSLNWKVLQDVAHSRRPTLQYSNGARPDWEVNVLYLRPRIGSSGHVRTTTYESKKPQHQPSFRNPETVFLESLRVLTLFVSKEKRFGRISHGFNHFRRSAYQKSLSGTEPRRQWPRRSQ